MDPEQHIDTLKSENRFLRMVIIGFIVLLALVVIVYAIQTMSYGKQLYAPPAASQPVALAAHEIGMFLV